MNIIDSPNELYLFNSVKAYNLFKGLKGIDQWSLTRKIWGHSGCLIDRSNIVSTPFKTKTLSAMELPVVDNDFSKTLHECCLEQARNILDCAVTNNKKIAIMYSGGIDSTCALVSFLSVASESEKKLITVLLNRDSILENYDFYKNHLAGKIRCKDSNSWENFINDHTIFITGEGGDQLFSNGFTKATDAIFTSLGWDKMKSKPNPDLIIKILKMVSDDSEAAVIGWERVVRPLIASSIIPIDSVGQALWYFHFTCKWQNVYLRILNNLIDSSKINDEYIKNNFKMFYQSTDIQKWILKNNENNICVSKFRDIKKPLKDIIFDYDKNEDYLINKTKIPSLGKLCWTRPSVGFITNTWSFKDHIDIDIYYNPDNSFL
jgi:hypothetical protein